MRYIAEQSRLEEVEPEEEEEEEEEEWYGDEIEAYLRGDESYEGELDVEVEVEEKPVGEERSGTVIAKKIMEDILENVAQITLVATPPSTPLNHSGEFTDTTIAEEPTATDLEGENTGKNVLLKCYYYYNYRFYRDNRG